MGCIESSLSRETHPENDPDTMQNQRHTSPAYGPTLGPDGAPVFSGFSLSDLMAATSNFSSELIVSESGEKAPNFVYKGRLKSGYWIAVKKFTQSAWPDPAQFEVQELSRQFLFCSLKLVKIKLW